MLVPLLALACLACGSSGGDSTVGDAGDDAGSVSGGAPLDESVRLATLSASEPVYRANLGKPKAERDAALVAFYLQRPEIEAAGISSSSNNVWARFTDGTTLIHFDNGGDPPPDAGVPARPWGAHLLVDVPDDVSAIAAFSLEPGWTDVTGEIGGYLVDAGYAARIGALTVDDLMHLSNLGVLFWQTHSGESELKPDAGLPLNADGGPPTAFAFMTSTVATAQLGQGTYKTLRDDGALALGAASIREADGGVGQEPRYAVTLKFINEQMKQAFAKSSLVAIDSCTGAAGAGAFEAAGAARFVSWNDLSGNLSPVAFERLFDRLLGMNAVGPLSTPKERPFAIDEVSTWMKSKGYDQDKTVYRDGSSSKAKLIFSSGANGDFGILRPTVMRVLNTAPAANEALYRLTIEGSFGDAPGVAARKVTYGGSELDVASWTAGSIIARLPDPPLSGDLQVSIGDRKSETVPMTEWVVPFTYTWIGQGTLKFVFLVECRLRADVRGIRTQPEQAVLAATTAVESLSDSGGSLSASGTVFDNNGQPIETWSGGGVLSWIPPRAIPPANFLLCSGFVNQNSSAVTAFAVEAGGQYTVARPNQGNTTGTAATRGLPLPITLPIDWPTRTVKAGKVDADAAQLGAWGVSATLTWPDVAPTFAPIDSDPR